RRGPGATNHVVAGGFIPSCEKVAYPNLMVHIRPRAVRYGGSQLERGHGYQEHVRQMVSDSHGSDQTRSRNPREQPAISCNYLSTAQDRREWVEAIHCARKILSQPAFAEFSGGEISPGPQVSSDEEILAWVARDAETALHPSGTCKMGTDAMSVIDPASMKV